MDFIEGLTKAERYDMIFVVLDKLSKYAYFIALAKSVAGVFVKEVVRLHKYPTSIVSDCHEVFFEYNIWDGRLNL